MPSRTKMGIRRYIMQGQGEKRTGLLLVLFRILLSLRPDGGTLFSDLPFLTKLGVPYFQAEITPFEP